MLDIAILAVAREFCEHTSVWKLALTPIDTIAGQATYTLPFPEDSELTRVIDITLLGGDDSSVLLWRYDDRERPGETIALPEPKYASELPPFSLSLEFDQIIIADDEIPEESVVGGLTINAAMQPTPDATTLPDFLLNQYSEEIKVGVLSRMMVMNRPWRDLVLAAKYEGDYNEKMNFVAYQSAVGKTKQRLRSRKW